MKRHLCFFVGTVALIFLSFPLFSQERDVYGVVPFLKGKKWGLVYPDGTEFYPPVFDTIYLQNVYSIYSVFGKEGEKERAIVEKGGNVMWLSPDKKLVAVAKVERTIKREEKIEKKKVAKEGIAPQEEISELVATPIDTNQYVTALSKESQNVTLFGQKGTPVEIKQTKDGYSFYRNGVHYPRLDAENYYKRECYNGRCQFVLLEKNGLQALIDLETLEFLVPFKYNRVQYHSWKDDWMTVVKEGLYGIVDLKGNELVPPKYQAVYGSVEIKDGKGYFTTVVKNNDRFFLLNHKSPDLRESDISYDYLYFSNYNFYTKPDMPLYIARLNGKKGVVNNKDSVIIPIKYDSISYTNDNRILLVYSNKKIGFYNIETGFVKEPVYDQVMGSYNLGNINRGTHYYIMYVRRGNKIFYIDRYGKEFISK